MKKISIVAPKEGENFKQPELAITLERIRDKGREGFYAGETANMIVNFMKEYGGIINQKDLTSYESKWRTPIHKKWKGYEVITSPPPSSGGIAINQWLSMYDILIQDDRNVSHNSTQYIHLLSEIGKRVFVDRAEYLGDPDFVKVPLGELIDDEYIASRTKYIDLNKISFTDDIKPGLKESEETTHFSIVDKWDNAVSNTTTINLGFGSGMVVTGAGFLLNDEMDNFSVKAGVPNVFGAVGGKANEIRSNKRMLSSMTPTIVLKNGNIALVTGAPGGTTIITSVYQSILNVIEFDMSAQDAVDAPRFHHQLLPKNVIRHHPGINDKTIAELTAMGYDLQERRFGDLQLIKSKSGQLDAASENAGRGKYIVLH